MTMDSIYSPAELGIIEQITHIIQTHTSLHPSDEGGKLYGEIDADYRDKLSDCTIRSIFLDNNPYDRFFNVVNDGYFEHESGCYEEVLKTIQKHFGCDFKTHKDFIRSWVYEHIYFEKPYEHYFNQDVQVNIIVNSGDMNFDYTLNNIFEGDYSEQSLKDREKCG
jgi:hypothetical protein